MTQNEIKELALDVATALRPYAAKGKIAGFRLIVAVNGRPGEVFPLITGSCVSDEVERLLENPEFVQSADAKGKTMLGGDS